MSLNGERKTLKILAENIEEKFSNFEVHQEFLDGAKKKAQTI